jgi:hypothetical protein
MVCERRFKETNLLSVYVCALAQTAEGLGLLLQPHLRHGGRLHGQSVRF